MQIKTVGAFEARRQFGKLISSVGFSGISVVVEKNGQRIAAIVPIQVLDDWEQERQEFFDDLRQMSESSELSEGDALRLANEAVEEVRTEKRKERQGVPSQP